MGRDGTEQVRTGLRLFATVWQQAFPTSSHRWTTQLAAGALSQDLLDVFR